MKKILITGAAGFIGFHLAQTLAQKPANITIIDNLSRGKLDEEFQRLLKNPAIKNIQADLTATDYYAQLDDYYDEIYHLAAINGTKYFYEKPQEVLRVNILSLLHLLEWIQAERCGKFLFTSSSEAYAGAVRAFPKDGKTRVPTREEIPLCIDDVFNERYSYGGSKAIGELLTINYMRSKKTPFSVVRYHNVYGPRMGFEHVIPEFCRRIYDRQNPFEIFGGDDTRAFCHIGDAVRASVMVMENAQCNGHIFHVGNSLEEIKIADLAEKMFRLSHFKAPLSIQPAQIGSVARRCPDTQKLSAFTGYTPQVPLEDGLQETISWYMHYFNTQQGNI